MMQIHKKKHIACLNPFLIDLDDDGTRKDVFAYEKKVRPISLLGYLTVNILIDGVHIKENRLTL